MIVVIQTIIVTIYLYITVLLNMYCSNTIVRQYYENRNYILIGRYIKIIQVLFLLFVFSRQQNIVDHDNENNLCK